ncbi:winged helix DNA-binding domain-containing protein [Nocardioides bizhenqiangii]|uniref:Winged helix DNA-binding domain-containing protein n=1 Tax=Nocardioides bizhenqiangii TaxID=3095076 RepID=A0ABZ0ZX04_9ACTN|nr:winged helix DNA-binding domain-containing protein [Nocardioides sp. HM61]WQQ28202.1 winged helix DNA-binding domain-containing protein [Nocardioides sp. HM61]
MRLTRQRLNRTLLLRQHLLERVAMSPEEMVRHLVGLQAQENLPPYLSLAARLTELDPYDVSRLLEQRQLVRLLTMRGTIHLLAPEDAAVLRPWVAPRIEQEIRVSQSVGDTREIERSAAEAALRDVLAEGPLPQKEIGLRLAERFPYPPTQLGQLARSIAPLAQLPPRGCWKKPGGVVYDYVDRWTGVPMAEPDVPDLVRRYLRAFGPATAADVTAWSAVTRLGPVVKGMDDLVQHEDEDGRVLYDVDGAPIADEDAPAPVRLLGTYDNVWLSHAARDRVTDPEARKSWMGTNGGIGNTLFADGWLAGIWRIVDDRVEMDRLHRDLTKAEKSELDEEIARVEAMLAR